MNKKGQILARQLIIIASWAVLLFTVVLMFLFQSFAKDEARTSLNTVQGSTAESTLAAYLRHTVVIAGDRVPFAEALALAVMTDNQLLIKKESEDFSMIGSNILSKRVHITADGIDWVFGELRGDPTFASTVLLLPNGKEVKVEYAEARIS